MKQRIESEIWKIRKQKTPNQNSIRKITPPDEESIRSFCNNFKHTNIGIMEVPEGEEREQGIENLCKKIMTGNFPNLVREVDIQVLEAQSPKQDEPQEGHTKTHHK